MTLNKLFSNYSFLIFFIGRGGNAWLSPDGCAMYSLQLHIPLDSILGRHISLLQHLSALATVSAVCSLPDLQVNTFLRCFIIICCIFIIKP